MGTYCQHIAASLNLCPIRGTKAQACSEKIELLQVRRALRTESTGRYYDAKLRLLLSSLFVFHKRRQ